MERDKARLGVGKKVNVGKSDEKNWEDLMNGLFQAFYENEIILDKPVGQIQFLVSFKRFFFINTQFCTKFFSNKPSQSKILFESKKCKKFVAKPSRTSLLSQKL